MSHKLDASRMFFISQRADRLFRIMQELNELADQMDDSGKLSAAADLIELRWKDEFDEIEAWKIKIDQALAEGESE